MQPAFFAPSPAAYGAQIDRFQAYPHRKLDRRPGRSQINFPA